MPQALENPAKEVFSGAFVLFCPNALSQYIQYIQYIVCIRQREKIMEKIHSFFREGFCVKLLSVQQPFVCGRQQRKEREQTDKVIQR